MLTSAALGDLKETIDEAAALRRDLIAEIAGGEQELASVRDRLSFAKTFIVRLWTRRQVELLSRRSWELTSALTRSRACLDACVVDIDCDLGAVATETFVGLAKAFETAQRSQRIWSVTEEVTTVAALRTVANKVVGRSPVQFCYANSPLIKTQERARGMPIGEGRILSIYPTFIAIGGDEEPLALLSFNDLQVRQTRLQFIEYDKVPEDSVIVDRTWRWANKGGGPDRRFRDNVQIPICLYGDLELLSDAGLHHRFIFSDASAAETLGSALTAHRMALSSTKGEPLSEPAPVEELDPIPPPAPPPQNFLADWITLALIAILALAAAAGGNGQLASVQPQPASAIQTPTTVEPATLPAAPPSPAPVVSANASSHSRTKSRVARHAPARQPERQTCIQVLTDPSQGSCQAASTPPVLVLPGHQ